jgi:PTH1 family peptidyl-tRNA hydrolase
VVGLGNPGPEHESDRHNAGFWCLDRLLPKLDPLARFNHEAKFFAELATCRLEGKLVHLLKPMTWMNRSGQAVLAVCNFYKILPQEILVIHDELDLLPGVVKIKFGGGSAGHNGLKDISLRLGQPDYWRLRLGIGHPRSLKLAQEVGDFVLHRPALEQFKLIEAAMQALVPPMKEFLVGQRESAIARIHRGVNLNKEDA